MIFSELLACGAVQLLIWFSFVDRFSNKYNEQREFGRSCGHSLRGDEDQEVWHVQNCRPVLQGTAEQTDEYIGEH